MNVGAFMVPAQPNLEDAIDLIRAKHSSLSASQQKVTEFLLENGLNAIHYTVMQIADSVNVNPSTVVRTAQSLGYDGFPELQDALRKQFIQRAQLSERLQIGSQQLIDELREGRAAGETSVLQTILREEINNMLNLTQNIPIDDFEAAVDSLDKAKSVFIIALGTSLPLALNFGNILRYVRPNTYIVKPGTGPIPSQLETLSSDDLLFSICVTRYTRQTLSAMDYAQNVGAKVVTLTDTLVSPAAKRADLSLIVPYRLWLYGNSVAMFALLNSLMGALFIRNSESAEKRLQHLDSIFESFQIHELDGKQGG
jgi:DNA-binding MurR/RpiR family transcriptional regulator